MYVDAPGRNTFGGFLFKGVTAVWKHAQYLVVVA
jgi:hypothetical protein